MEAIRASPAGGEAVVAQPSGRSWLCVAVPDREGSRSHRGPRYSGSNPRARGAPSPSLKESGGGMRFTYRASSSSSRLIPDPGVQLMLLDFSS